jgi:hypothetical protein
MTTSDDFGASGEASDPKAAQVASLSRQLGDQFVAGQTPRQEAIARRIFDRMKAGANADDVKDLIAELSRTATEDQRNRAQQPPQPQAGQRRRQAGEEDEWSWQWDDGSGRQPS